MSEVHSKVPFANLIEVTATLAILAGGEGRRMGGPKGLLRVGGKPILDYLLDRFRWNGPTLLITAPGREQPPGAGRFTQEVIDPVAGEGPLRGILTALEAAKTDAVIVTTCDMPRVESHHLAWLLDALAQRPAAQLIMLTHGDRCEPFPLAIRRAALALLTSHFTSGDRSMHSLRHVAGAVVEVPAPPDWPDDVWANLNTPADLAALGDLGP